jgi:hypothetical protein
MSSRYLLGASAIIIVAVGGATVWRSWSTPPQPPLSPIEGRQVSAVDPDTPGPIYVDAIGSGENATTEDLLGRADAVLWILLDNNRVVQVDTGHYPSVLSFSVYEFRVRGTVKGDFHPGDIVRIARFGRRGSYEPDFPRPGVGEQFLVFLKWSRDLKAYEHLYQRLAFRVVTGEVQPMGSEHRELSGRMIGDVVRDLRRLVKTPE